MINLRVPVLPACHQAGNRLGLSKHRGRHCGQIQSCSQLVGGELSQIRAIDRQIVSPRREPCNLKGLLVERGDEVGGTREQAW